jgi:hypothetical protein
MSINRKFRLVLTTLSGIGIFLYSGVAYCQETGGFPGKTESNSTGSSSTAPKPGAFANVSKVPVVSPGKKPSAGYGFGKTMMPGAPLPGITDAVPFPISMDFQLDWTSCQIHRVSTDSAIVMILPGTISSSNAIYWNLSNTEPGGDGLADLNFTEDIFGRAGPNYGSNIPLVWEIAIDGGPMTAIPVQPDNSLLVLFPAGQHNFQVRITGLPQQCASDGYYNLQLNQSLVPQL